MLAKQALGLDVREGPRGCRAGQARGPRGHQEDADRREGPGREGPRGREEEQPRLAGRGRRRGEHGARGREVRLHVQRSGRRSAPTGGARRSTSSSPSRAAAARASSGGGSDKPKRDYLTKGQSAAGITQLTELKDLDAQGQERRAVQPRHRQAGSRTGRYGAEDEGQGVPGDRRSSTRRSRAPPPTPSTTATSPPTPRSSCGAPATSRATSPPRWASRRTSST